jgi:hypothetical protein
MVIFAAVMLMDGHGKNGKLYVDRVFLDVQRASNEECVQQTNQENGVTTPNRACCRFG